MERIDLFVADMVASYGDYIRARLRLKQVSLLQNDDRALGLYLATKMQTDPAFVAQLLPQDFWESAQNATNTRFKWRDILPMFGPIGAIVEGFLPEENTAPGEGNETHTTNAQLEEAKKQLAAAEAKAREQKTILIVSFVGLGIALLGAIALALAKFKKK